MLHNSPFTKSGRKDVCIEDIVWSMAHSTVAEYRGHTNCIWTNGMHALLKHDIADSLLYSLYDRVAITFSKRDISNCYMLFELDGRLKIAEYLKLPIRSVNNESVVIFAAEKRVTDELILCSAPNTLVVYDPRVVVQKLLRIYRQWIDLLQIATKKES